MEVSGSDCPVRSTEPYLIRDQDVDAVILLSVDVGDLLCRDVVERGDLLAQLQRRHLLQEQSVINYQGVEPTR